VTLTGQVGRIDWGYYPAAALEGYTVTMTKVTRPILRARVVAVDVYNLRQRPLLFLAPHAQGTWEWTVEQLQLEGDPVVALTATLGACRTLPRAERRIS